MAKTSKTSKKTAAAPAAEKTAKVTPLEAEALRGIAFSLYSPTNGAEPESFEETGAVWSWDVADNGWVAKKSIAGVFASLQKKGLVLCHDSGTDEASVSFTKEGFRVFKSLPKLPEAKAEKTAAAPAPEKKAEKKAAAPAPENKAEKKAAAPAPEKKADGAEWGGEAAPEKVIKTDGKRAAFYSQRIEAVTKEMPHRAGTFAAKQWEMMLASKTVGDYSKAKADMGYLRFWVLKGHVKLS